MGYDYALVEAKDTAWESFPGLRDHTDLAIILAIKFQNLTTEIHSGGSYAAAKEHGKGDVAQIAADNRAWKTTILRDFARPFAYLNFGNADLAPITDLDVPEPPREDYASNAELFQKFGTALEVMARAGIKFKDVEALRAFAQCQFGLNKLPDFDIQDPPTTTTANAAMVTAQASQSTADASHKVADAGTKKTDADIASQGKQDNRADKADDRAGEKHKADLASQKADDAKSDDKADDAKSDDKPKPAP
jgi:hypothetical protein